MDSAENQLIGESRPPIRCTQLISRESRRLALYRIWIEDCENRFRVCKESGASGKVWHRRAWELGSMEEAERLSSKRIREKMDPGHKRPRIYRRVLQ